MALIDCKFFSSVLGLSTEMTVILPEETVGQIGQQNVSQDETKVLYLLHGRSDDNTTWTRRTSIERYAAAYGIAVVMPNAHLSFYTNMAQGGRYQDFIFEEISEKISKLFGLKPAKEHCAVAGLSMGGYGAIKWALTQPERFCFAAGLSGAYDIADFWRMQDNGNADRDLVSIYGSLEKFTGGENDIQELINRCHHRKAELPELFITCGTDDFIFGHSQFLHAALNEKSIPHTYEEHPGSHDWGYWDQHIQRALATWLG
ncbi:alpha/beta hydrolase family protein [Rubellicoccus peritrichatus]|uniref:Alpha/beta hydrolase family protein n=1 Tax=Rubellicoccus peritrichatus TaxID=3080537 RepID=A0AAQ3LFU5_9BACT|nr:alpha/beta hydrolase family protein [Puniceicoccus sp. CR14]WOO43060.1 alpha/beta hydrolase family protein [Puniceicoccus sp. CR14]